MHEIKGVKEVTYHPSSAIAEVQQFGIGVKANGSLQTLNAWLTQHLGYLNKITTTFVYYDQTTPL